MTSSHFISFSLPLLSVFTSFPLASFHISSIYIFFLSPLHLILIFTSFVYPVSALFPFSLLYFPVFASLPLFTYLFSTYIISFFLSTLPIYTPFLIRAPRLFSTYFDFFVFIFFVLFASFSSLHFYYPPKYTSSSFLLSLPHLLYVYLLATPSLILLSCFRFFLSSCRVFFSCYPLIVFHLLVYPHNRPLVAKRIAFVWDFVWV